MTLHQPIRKATHHRSAGFSLLEMVMTITILSIVAGVGTVGMSNAFSAYLTARTIEPLASNARLALERLRRELQSAQSCTGISQPNGAGTLQFTNDRGSVILVNQGAIPTNAIYMRFDGGAEEWLLAPSVEANSLRFQVSPCTLAGPPPTTTPGLVTISFTMTATTIDNKILKLPFRTAVYVRST
ncbi:MAG: type II secretion system protein [Magnetococcales bacterium]|nr:type II secretion system protein [Magnetococcales bacterium]